MRTNGQHIELAGGRGGRRVEGEDECCLCSTGLCFSDGLLSPVNSEDGKVAAFVFSSRCS